MQTVTMVAFGVVLVVMLLGLTTVLFHKQQTR